MPTKQEPFSAAIVELASCSLKSSLAESEVRLISQFLAVMDPWLTLGFSSTGISNYLCRHDPALKRFGIFHGETAIGVLCIRYPWLRGPYIELLGIEAAYQGKGIAKEAVAWIEEQTAPHARNIWVVASSFNTKALVAYERLGFSRISLIEDLVSDGKNEVLMRKAL